jgi:transcriptional regulator with XRE-family HTH domain
MAKAPGQSRHSHKESFQRLLKELRRERGLTQAELAERSNYSVVYIGLLETGKRNPSIRAIFDILKALETRPSTACRALEWATGFSISSESSLALLKRLLVSGSKKPPPRRSKPGPKRSKS